MGLGRDTNHSPPCSAEVKNEKELYLLSLMAPAWGVVGQLSLLLLLLYFKVKGTVTSVYTPSHKYVQTASTINLLSFT
jgi:hypothetical protein